MIQCVETIDILCIMLGVCKVELILTIDQGTTSTRVLLVDKAGNVAAKAQNEFTQFFPQESYVEHDPLEILESTYKAINDAMAAVDGACILATAITNQRETTVVWNKTTGKPIYNAIVWQCRRTAEICENIPSDMRRHIKKSTGLNIDAYFSATKVKWILDNVPDARQQMQSGDLLFGTIDTWLIWNLTSGKVNDTDYTNASRTMLFDIDGLYWDSDICEYFDISTSMLPKALHSDSCFGTISALEVLPLKNVPILSVLGDQQAALFGQACFKKGDAKNTYGTGCFILVNTGEQRVYGSLDGGLLSTIAWGYGGKVQYAVEGSIFNAGTAIQWLQSIELISTPRECDGLAEAVADNGGVYFVPAFTGLGAPHWDMYARGSMFGITRGTTRAHIARAALESVSHQVCDFFEDLEAELGISPKILRVDGGITASKFVMQMQSDLLGIQIRRPKNAEDTALGAAFMAGLSCGLWHSLDEIIEINSNAISYSPSMDSEDVNCQRGMWKKAVSRAKGWIQDT